MTKKILLTALCCLMTVSSLFAAKAVKPVTLKSPNTRICVSFSGFKYSVTADGQEMIAPSEISMTLADGTVYGRGAKLQSVKRKSFDSTYKTPFYKKASVKDQYNEMTLVYKNFNLVFRAYNEGVAYRFVSKSDKNFKVKSEDVEFRFPDNWKVWAAYCNSKNKDKKDIFCSFESHYNHVNVKELDSNKAAFLPVAAEASNGYKIVITEADLFSYPGLLLTNWDNSTSLKSFHAALPKDVWQGGHNQLQGLVKSRYDYIADCTPGTAFPWRIIQIAREDRELTNSDLVYKLSTPADPNKDWSWVKPGKVAWDWWNDWNIGGVDFKAGINNKTYQHYIDFASENGIEYVILDEGWAVCGEANLFNVVPEINIEDLCAYAKSKNVGIILWAGYWAVNKDMENVFLHYSRLGVKGFKIDFMDRDDQQMVDFYTACAKMGAKYRMMVDFHGAFKPAGLQRTYPNVLNFEGVYGLEQLKWLKDSASQVNYEVEIPFIRMVAGPMDYTPGAMRNSTRDTYRPVVIEPMSQGTRCRQLAEYIIYDAPFEMMCDSPTNYRKEQECTTFMAGVPTVWDETVAVGGKIGEFVTMARRSGENWWAASMTNWDERDLTLILDFLPAGSFKAEIFKDGANADKLACDYAKEERTVISTDKIKLHLAPGGGFAIKFTKE